MRTRWYLGIDPGKSGGIAEVSSAGEARTHGMPATEADLWELVAGLSYSVGRAVVERIGGFAGSAQPGSRMFNFGWNYGLLRMALTAAGIPFEDVPPQTWQKALGITPRRKHDKVRQVVITKGKRKGQMRDERYGGETDGEWKNRLKQKAQQLFPGARVTLDVADALLIAEFCRRLEERS